MRGFTVTLQRSVTKNGEFVHNEPRRFIVHAKDEETARRMGLVACRESEVQTLEPGTVFGLSQETLQDVRYLGEVTVQTVLVYIDPANPNSPTLVPI